MWMWDIKTQKWILSTLQKWGLDSLIWNTSIQTQTERHFNTHTHRINSVCLFTMYLTRCHGSTAFHSWVLINSINSLPIPSIPLLLHPPPSCHCHCPALNSHSEYVATCCYGNNLPGEKGCAVSELTPRCGSPEEGKSIAEYKEDFFFFISSFHFLLSS